jgi:hypothetical protein
MFKKLTAAAAILAVGILAVPASAASFSINEPLSTPGALDSSWTVSGTGFTPAIVANVGDTPANAMRLTEAVTGQSGFVLYNTPISTNKGIDVTFRQAQWGGDGADGIVFFVKNAANTSTTPGGTGGAMGYSPGGVDGLAGALLGIGLDAYGSFGSAGGTGCEGTTFTGTTGVSNVNAVTLRGPGNGQAGYCLLADSYKLVDNAKAPLVQNYTTRQAADRKIRVVIDPATKENPKVVVYYQDEQIIEAPLPDAFSDVSNVKIGFSAGTGGSVDNHDVWGLVSQAADPLYEAPEEEPTEEPVEEPVDNGNTEEELADTGLGSDLLWYGFALSLLMLTAGAFAVTRSRKN